MEAFLLHRRRFKETSLLVEFLTFERGRISAVAKGALRAKSKLGTTLLPSIRMHLEITGRSNLPTLTKAEAIEHFQQIHGKNIYSFLYVNELLTKLTVPNDPVPKIYLEYQNLIAALSSGCSTESHLRYFELTLLEMIGVKPTLDHTTDTNKLISPDKKYYFHPVDGLSETKDRDGQLEIRGETLVNINNQVELVGSFATEAKHLLRMSIGYHLDGKQVNSRRLFLDKPK